MGEGKKVEKEKRKAAAKKKAAALVGATPPLRTNEFDIFPVPKQVKAKLRAARAKKKALKRVHEESSDLIETKKKMSKKRQPVKVGEAAAQAMHGLETTINTLKNVETSATFKGQASAAGLGSIHHKAAGGSPGAFNA